MPKILKTARLDASSAFHDLDDEYTESFRMDPPPVLVQLHPGNQLYKWAGTSRIDAASGHRVRNTIFNASGFASPYWAPWKSMPQYQVPGFAELRKRYRNVDGGVGRPQEFARARFAISNEFSEMNSLVKSELLQPVWGFLGMCSPQPVSRNAANPRKVLFIGGDYQLVIPGMQARDIFQL